MKLLAVVLALCLSACTLPSSKEMQYDALRAATWQITIDERGTCSGVFIAPHHLLTAAHCKGDKMSVGGQPAMVVKVDEDKDLMLLLTVVDGPVVRVANSEPVVDTEVVVVGYPLGLAQYLTEGRLQGPILDSRAPAGRMAISAPGSFGNSGGPVVAFINGVPRVIGIVSAGAFGMGLSTHLIIAINTSSLKEFLGLL